MTTRLVPGAASGIALTGSLEWVVSGDHHTTTSSTRYRSSCTHAVLGGYSELVGNELFAGVFRLLFVGNFALQF